MSEDAQTQTGLIGPNAILQMLPVLDGALGVKKRDHLLEITGVTVPDGSEMIPEADAARLHQHLRAEYHDLAPALATEAGRRTANYILAHRIPPLAQTLLKALPAPLAARALSRAISRHAWTFAGSGAFKVIDPLTFEIADNPVIRNETAPGPICHWHAAVFARLYHVLVRHGCSCREVACAAAGDPVCRFEISY
ncbi:MAG: bacteriochlorophyll 4-vinyl reductase [Paracoccaceae bacterium]|nr:bacteriochlorophyll 4-vinyl reductase [Paracoccaceae bacterium]